MILRQPSRAQQNNELSNLAARFARAARLTFELIASISSSLPPLPPPPPPGRLWRRPMMAICERRFRCAGADSFACKLAAEKSRPSFWKLRGGTRARVPQAKWLIGSPETSRRRRLS